MFIPSHLQRPIATLKAFSLSIFPHQLRSGSLLRAARVNVSSVLGDVCHFWGPPLELIDRNLCIALITRWGSNGAAAELVAVRLEAGLIGVASRRVESWFCRNKRVLVSSVDEV